MKYMEHQVVVIHGGDNFGTYEEYISFLKNFEIESLDYFTQRGWKDSLQEKLGKTFQVILPRMPNAFNARYIEWELWFKKLIPFLTDNVIFVGHSLGGIFLAKYLSQNKFPGKIAATFLLGAPFDDEGSDEPLLDFALPESLDLFATQGGKIFVYHSADDPVVNYFQQRKYLKALPSAEAVTFDGKEHFGQEEFPELVDALRKV